MINKGRFTPTPFKTYYKDVACKIWIQRIKSVKWNEESKHNISIISWLPQRELLCEIRIITLGLERQLSSSN